MAKNPLLAAIKKAEGANRQWGRILAKMGTQRNPRGKVLTAYAVAVRMMRKEYGERIPDKQALLSILQMLESSIREEAIQAIRDGQSVGVEAALAQLDAYGVNGTAASVDAARLVEAQSILEGEIAAQINRASALVRTGADEALVIGDGTRRGVLKSAPIVVTALHWATSLGNNGFDDVVTASGGTFKRQAIAALDARTTDCCLAVHGQVVGMNERFHLRGTPRYADELMNPPFHDWCRTATALYLEEYDMGITEQMRDGAAQIRSEREETGTNPERKPVTARVN